MSVFCMFFIAGQTAGPVGTKLGTGIHLDPMFYALDMRMEAPRGTEVELMP